MLSYENTMQFIEGLDAMAVLNKEGIYLYVNPGWCGLTGLTPKQALGRRVWDILPDTRAQTVLETGKPVIGHPVSIGGKLAFTTYLPKYASDGSLNGCYLYVIINGMADARVITKRINELSSQVEFYKKELSRERGARYNLDNIIGCSQAVLHLKEQIKQAAKSASTVLIEGETGSGKELIAHAIHSLSARHAANFVRVNCSAIPQELMESEFFGYCPGAFTGAAKRGKIGRFELANNGSIFLDEVNLLTSTMQPKFLRVLQEHEIDPVGSDRSIPVDVRVISATNASLKDLVEAGKFRSDLYFRLNVIRILAPPLRTRKEDIPLLVENLILRLNYQLGMVIQGVSDEGMNVLMGYDWPGNVRELQNTIESAMNMTNSPVLQKRDFEHLLKMMHAKKRRALLSPDDYRLGPSKRMFERDMVKEALAAADGCRVKAAGLLGISRTVLYKKMNQYGLK